MNDLRADVAVVGGGIVGLACALSSALRGHSVVLFERHARARGASVRNFGMIWPVGQEPGRIHERSLRTREIWLDLAPRAGLWCESVGSLHLAYHRDELAVLEEFAQRAPQLGYNVELLQPAAVRERSEAVVEEGLLGGLWSSMELCVDPRQAVAQLPAYLADTHSVQLRFATPVIAVDGPCVQTPLESWTVGHVFVCTGDDFETLYPEHYARSGLERCKLQMMRTHPQPGGWRLGPHLAAGLTLRHYAAFRICDSLQAVRDRVREEYPDFDRWGIHVMASQNGVGEVTIGDSHEYGDAITPFDHSEVDELILAYLRSFVNLPDLHISERWHGVYPRHPERADYIAHPSDGVTIINGVGGAGMTTAFGLAEEIVGHVL